MFDSHARGSCRADQNALCWPERTVRQLPRNAVGSHCNIADFDASSAALRIDTAEPQMMFACSIYLPFEASGQVLNGPTHELRVSFGVSKGVSGALE